MVLIVTEAHQNIAIPSKQLGITGNIRLSWLISFILLFLMISISAGFSFLNYKSLKKTALDEIDKKLLIATDMAKESLTKNYHDQIKNEDSISKDEFVGIVKNFNRLCLAHDLEYIWSVMEIDGVIRFTSCTSQFKKEHRNHAGFLEVHSNPQA